MNDLLENYGGLQQLFMSEDYAVKTWKFECFELSLFCSNMSTVSKHLYSF